MITVSLVAVNFTPIPRARGVPILCRQYSLYTFYFSSIFFLKKVDNLFYLSIGYCKVWLLGSDWLVQRTYRKKIAAGGLLYPPGDIGPIMLYQRR